MSENIQPDDLRHYLDPSLTDFIDKHTLFGAQELAQELVSQNPSAQSTESTAPDESSNLPDQQQPWILISLAHLITTQPEMFSDLKPDNRTWAALWPQLIEVVFAQQIFKHAKIDEALAGLAMHEILSWLAYHTLSDQPKLEDSKTEILT